MATITEDSIKQAMLPFLKAYYKYRPRMGETVGQTDLVNENGIIVDGQISFPTDTGRIFSATFEATSLDKRDEVFFSKQSKLLWWDSLAVAAIVTTFLFSLTYYYDWLTMKNVGVVIVVLFFIVFFAGMGLLYWLAAGSLRRYRYIYAVEQFKRYHADEQWIAFAEDVFAGNDPRYLTELKNQCIFNGFGLVEIKEDLAPNLLITPSRQEVFQSKRKIYQFLERYRLGEKMRGSQINTMWNSFYESWKPETGGKQAFKRYQKSILHQLGIIVVSLVMIGFIVWRQMSELPVVYEDEENYESNLAERRKNQVASEPDNFEMNRNGGVRGKKANPYLDVDTTETGNLTPRGEKRANLEIYVNAGDQAVVYDCERFFNLKGTHYLLLDSRHSALEEALSRLRALRTAGFEANCLWMGCFNEQNDTYLIYLDSIFERVGDADKELPAYNNRLKKKELWMTPLTVEPIRLRS